VEQLECRLTPAVTVRFDYTYDTSGFFADSARRAVLEHTARTIGDRLGDDLGAIAPSAADHWTASVYNPTTGETVSRPDLAVGANEVVVYVGAKVLPEPQLGLATTGGYEATGGPGWLDAVRGRGQAGAGDAPKTDFSTWGGMITFDADTPWSFDGTPAAGEYDFESVAAHELLHIFGFGVGEPAFVRNVAGWDGASGVFVGPAVQALAGGPVPVSGDFGVPDHWGPEVSYKGQASPVREAIPAGARRPVTELDLAALDDIGWEVGTAAPAPTPAPTAVPTPTAAPVAVAVPVPPVAPPVSPPPVAPPPAPRAVPAVADPTAPRLAIGTPAGVVTVDAGGRAVATAAPTAPGVGAVRVAQADLTGDGRPDTVLGSAPGTGNRVAVVGADGTPGVEFQPFESWYTGGVFLSAGDLTADGVPDLVVTPDQGGGPVAAIYDGAALGRGQAAQVSRFWGIDDPNFRGGARTAVGDINRDGVPDLVVAAGTGGGPRVSLYDGRAFAAGRLAQLAPDFFAFESGLRNGVFPAVADVTGDGFGDLIVGAGPGGGPRVKAFSGRDLLAGRVIVAADFFAGDVSSRGGVRLAVADVDADGRPDLVTAAGAPGSPVEVYRADAVTRSATPTPSLSVAVPVDAPDGLFIG
jgi:hypothetical protein